MVQRGWLQRSFGYTSARDCWGLTSQGHHEQSQLRAGGILPSQLDVCDLIKTAGEFFIYFSPGKDRWKQFFSVWPKYFFDSFRVFIKNEKKNVVAWKLSIKVFWIAIILMQEHFFSDRSFRRNQQAKCSSVMPQTPTRWRTHCCGLVCRLPFYCPVVSSLLGLRCLL